MFPLSPTGEEQARALAEWLADHREEIDLFWVSPYLRARQTSEIALGDDATSARIAIDERLRDRELGILDLLTRRGVARLHPEETDRRRHLGKFYHRPPGGESWADVALRLRSFLGDHGHAAGDTALLVAHDAVVMLFLYLLLGLPEPELLDFAAAQHSAERLGHPPCAGGRRLEARRVLERRSPPARRRGSHRAPGKP